MRIGFTKLCILNVTLLGNVTSQMQPIATDVFTQRGKCVCGRSLVTTMISAKMANQDANWGLTWGEHKGPRIKWGSRTPWERALLKG